MMAKKTKFNVMAMAILLIIGFAKESIAFPVPATDNAQTIESAKVTANQVKEIYEEGKQVYESGKKIANGGYAEGLNDLFGDGEKEGSLDRFGNSLKNLKSSKKKSEDKTKEETEKTETDKAERSADTSKETAKETASSEQGKAEALQETKNTAKAARQAAEVQNTYNFLNTTGNSAKKDDDSGTSEQTSDDGTKTKKKGTILSNIFKSFTNKNKSNKDGSSEGSK